MAREGRIEGRVSADGKAYELVQYGEVRQSIPLPEAYASDKLARSIAQNRWEPLP